MEAKKHIVVFYYDKFAEFEVVFSLLYLGHHQISAVALENREYRSIEGQRFLPDKVLEEIDVEKTALFLIPGGNPYPLLKNERLRSFIRKLIADGAIVAGICGGADLLVGMDFLEGKKATGNADDPDLPPGLADKFFMTDFQNELVVRDGNLITAQSDGYEKLAQLLAEIIG